ncbi:hypothetical protein EAL2_c16350 [Peptoclostridium acidaminophilum DSM 3953]|uniref:Type IV pilus assembly protein PilM n=1 Tax=Peptoclostridium acidaminophilum DSM 3953 TaxID=1286171 RepID=W8T7Q1_PEPAC|nr:pilus assembly protein PilM [Peptoclostridium acidaminophilum]AHM56930.1 hypothetical protein EAL2_c16350 [Peptoclostridium acidaminophilum DSM 3953]
MRKKLVGIDIGSHNIKLVAGKINKGMFEADGYEIIKTPAGAFLEDGTLNLEVFFGSNPFEDELSEAVARLGCKNGECFLSLSSSALIIRERKFPPASNKEIGSIVKMEAHNFLLGLEEDYILDYKVIDEVVEEGKAMLKCIVAAVPRNVIESYMQLIEQCGLRLNSVDIHSGCVSNFSSMAGVEPGRDTLVIDMGARHTRFVIFSGSDYFAEIEIVAGRMDSLESLGKFAQEVRRVMDYYRTRKFGSQIDNIVVMGGASNSEGILEYLESVTNVAVGKINVPPYFEKISADRENGTQDYSMLIPAIGAVLRLKSKQINLLPEEIIKKRKAGKKYVAAGVAAIVLIGFLSGIYIGISREIDRLSKLNKQMERDSGTLELASEHQAFLDSVEKRVEEKRQILERIEEENESFTSMFSSLEKKLPADIGFINVTSSSGGEIVIKGTAGSEVSVAELVHNLKDDGYFEKVFVSSIERDSSENSGCSFTLTCSFGR